MQKLLLTFELKSHVKIIPLELIGRVTGVSLSETGIEYRVRYFDNCEPRQEYFFVDELEKVRATDAD